MGKTTILDCLAQSFGVSVTSVKKTAGLARGNWSISVSINEINLEKTFDVTSFHPGEKVLVTRGFYQNANEVIVFKTHRDIPYKNLKSIATDPQKDETTFAQETIGGSLPEHLKNWFVNRHLWSKHEEHLDEAQLKNIGLAKDCFKYA